MRIAVTGADGFIGKNLRVRLAEEGFGDTILVTRNVGLDTKELSGVEVVFHLAGVNRPQDPIEFETGNVGFTKDLCDTLRQNPIPPSIILASSVQAVLANPYGNSKRHAERIVEEYGRLTGANVYIARLTNVFGKWSKPNYNSAVATFCYNIARGLPITVMDRAAPLRLVYIDDVVNAFIDLAKVPRDPIGFTDISPIYETTLGEVVDILYSFVESRRTLVTPPVGTGLQRALHATFLSFLEPAAFSYTVPTHGDPRGAFVEVLKTRDSGQISYFTAHPGITRGDHYHHSKTEKFLVIKGVAQFSFCHLISGETFDLRTRGGEARIVETIPGWIHNITNVGDDELIVLLWANEIFDRSKPDTIARKVNS